MDVRFRSMYCYGTLLLQGTREQPAEESSNSTVCYNICSDIMLSWGRKQRLSDVSVISDASLIWPGMCAGEVWCFCITFAWMCWFLDA